ncbi:hypothetical protein QWY31_15565 [Cytophagales bacterium LB-30]|uniref:Outer membrane protein beta-barrel domain-containing protein n=1 Tax=Shiella aurantiaca TaxID=3058365 RepID=A0ABT8F9K2_9BACT|nr:DUF6588 family protein [Shiella aurantiaca]MDN4166929.1 hypothetical protein [Shiella aurantiaca]
MKKRLSQVFVGLLMVMFAMAWAPSAYAQGADDMIKFILASRGDAEKITESYSAPFLKGFGYGINAGWNNTARPHKTLGFDLTVTVSPVFIPAADEVFTFNNAEYTSIQLAPGSSDQISTIFGPQYESGDANIPELQVEFDAGNFEPALAGETVTANFPMNAGLGFKEDIGYNFVPMPMAQLSVGIVKGTELKLRYVPTIALGDAGEIGMFGMGVKHDFKQWIPGIKHLPFDMSGFIGFTRLKANYGVDSESLGLTLANDGIEVRNPNNNQAAVFSSNGTVIQGFISKKLLFFTPYVGIGFQRVSTRLAMEGDYDIHFQNATSQGNVLVNTPLDLKVAEGSLMASVGAQVKILWVLAMHAEYTVAKYNTFTFGFGINIR